MKRQTILVMLALGALLVTATLAFAQGVGSSSGEEDPATEPEALPVSTLTVVNSLGERVPVQVEIADTDAERRTGLMGRSALAEDAGMLFVFDREQPLSFWMKNTLIPLSVAYIDEGGTIVDIQDMQPLDETSHPSAAPAKYALEANQGFFEAHGINVGDRLE